ncbi:MAG: TIGR02147 family protein [Xanthomonadaceae bacterium]|nr:TIGR02147 family protein [Xanthomonadaceae bacterium]
MKQSIYQYRSASRYLLDRVADMQTQDQRFSVRQWSKEMGFQTHSLISMVLQGKRNLTLKQVPYLSRGLKLSTPETLFFQGLIQVENAKTPEEKRWCELWVSELRPKSIQTIREVDEYAAIADWIHPALLALSDTAASFRNASEAAKALGLKDKTHEIAAAIARLESLSLLKKTPRGYYFATCNRMTTKDDVANAGAREYHRQAAALAAEKVEPTPITEREYQSMALAIPKDKLPLAKDLIRKFRTQFSAAMESTKADSVYQLNLHFFPLTNSKVETKGASHEISH